MLSNRYNISQLYSTFVADFKYYWMRKQEQKGYRVERESLTKFETNLFNYTRYRKECKADSAEPKKTFSFITRTISFLFGLISILKNIF